MPGWNDVGKLSWCEDGGVGPCHQPKIEQAEVLSNNQDLE